MGVEWDGEGEACKLTSQQNYSCVLKNTLKKTHNESWIDNFMIRSLLGLILCFAANTRKIAKEDTCKNVCP